MAKVISCLIGLILLVIGVINFFSSLFKLDGSGIKFVFFITVIGIIWLLITAIISNTSKSEKSNKAESKSSVTNSKPLIEQSTVKKSVKEFKQISYKDLNPDDVIRRYLTSNHSSWNSDYKYDSYFKAEFDCMLNSLKKVEIQINDTKVYRNNEILTPYEKSKNIISTTRFSTIKDFIALDVETTGLKTGYNDIIEISAIRFVDFKPQEIFTTLLKPRKPIPPEATAINGITNDMVKEAPKFSQIYDSLKEFIGKSNLVMHNAKFDFKFLYVSGLEINPENQNIYDTLELSRRAIRDWDGKPYDSYKLADICSEVYIEFDGAHRSSADALAAGLLFNEIVKVKKDTDNLLEIF